MTVRLVVASTLLALGGLAFSAPAPAATIGRDGPAPAGLVQLAQAGGTVTVQSKAGYAKLRSGPSTSSEVLDKVNQGTKLEVLGRSGGWTQVKVGDKTGYINDHLLRR